MEAKHLLRLFNEYTLTPSSSIAAVGGDSPLDYLKVTLICLSCSRSEEYALRQCVSGTPRCSCGAEHNGEGLKELIGKVSALGSRARVGTQAPFDLGNDPVRVRRQVVLLVEDDAASELLTRKAIERCDIACDIHVARDGKQALSFLTNATMPRPDLVLLDVCMPVMDGFEVLKVSRADDTILYVPIVMLTTSTQPESVDEAFALGANGYVVKGGSLAKFRDDIAATLRFWLLTSLRPTAEYAQRVSRYVD